MTVRELEHIITNNELPDISRRFEMRVLIEKYPYFQAVIFIYLKCLFIAEDNLFRQELQRLSVFVTDRRALFYYVLESEYERFFVRTDNRKEINKSRTDILLNAFFESMDDDTIEKQVKELYSNAGIPVSDYLAEIGLEEPKVDSSSEMKGQDIIDRFIDNNEKHTQIKFDPDKEEGSYYRNKYPSDDEDSLNELQDDLFFTETLANIYIKQQKYERAYEIIKQLNLNFPEKNIYFANQISFLEKLIINKKNKK